jgi:hypothetical protein
MLSSVVAISPLQLNHPSSSFVPFGTRIQSLLVDAAANLLSLVTILVISVCFRFAHIVCAESFFGMSFDPLCGVAAGSGDVCEQLDCFDGWSKIDCVCLVTGCCRCRNRASFFRILVVNPKFCAGSSIGCHHRTSVIRIGT